MKCGLCSARSDKFKCAHCIQTVLESKQRPIQQAEEACLQVKHQAQVLFDNTRVMPRFGWPSVLQGQEPPMIKKTVIPGNPNYFSMVQLYKRRQLLLAQEQQHVANQKERLNKGKSITRHLNLLDKEILYQKRQYIDSLTCRLQEYPNYIQQATNRMESIQQEMVSLNQQYKSTCNMLIYTKRILVRELVGIFKLRRVQRQVAPVDSSVSMGLFRLGKPRESSSTSLTTTEYRILNMNYTLAKMTDKHVEKLNATVGHVVHMLHLLAHYLDVSLPFDMYSKGAKMYIRNLQDNASFPLLRHDDQSDRYVMALSMLNYNIFYLCYSQGVPLELDKIVATVENLALCCQSSMLGQNYDPVRGFHLDFNKAYKAHVAAFSFPASQKEEEWQWIDG